MTDGFAESTIDAAVWLIVFQPHDLPAFLRSHPPGNVLERAARKRIADNKARRERERA
jgi:hypothetical protein